MVKRLKPNDLRTYFDPDAVGYSAANAQMRRSVGGCLKDPLFAPSHQLCFAITLPAILESRRNNLLVFRSVFISKGPKAPKTAHLLPTSMEFLHQHQVTAALINLFV
jgi:hypothetical protein